MTTLQTRAVVATLQRLRHATNLQIHEALEDPVRDLSLTSLHRITARLVERGEIGVVPSDARQVILDANPEVHDHFICTKCGGVVDIELPAETIDAIQAQLGTHLAEAGLVVRGTCAFCRPTEGSDVSVLTEG